MTWLWLLERQMTWGWVLEEQIGNNDKFEMKRRKLGVAPPGKQLFSGQGAPKAQKKAPSAKMTPVPQAFHAWYIDIPQW
jgi:hypothetical protein